MTAIKTISQGKLLSCLHNLLHQNITGDRIQIVEVIPRQRIIIHQLSGTSCHLYFITEGMSGYSNFAYVFARSIKRNEG